MFIILITETTQILPSFRVAVIVVLLAWTVVGALLRKAPLFEYVYKRATIQTQSGDKILEDKQINERAFHQSSIFREELVVASSQPSQFTETSLRSKSNMPPGHATDSHHTTLETPDGNRNNRTNESSRSQPTQSSSLR